MVHRRAVDVSNRVPSPDRDWREYILALTPDEFAELKQLEDLQPKIALAEKQGDRETARMLSIRYLEGRLALNARVTARRGG